MALPQFSVAQRVEAGPPKPCGAPIGPTEQPRAPEQPTVSIGLITN